MRKPHYWKPAGTASAPSEILVFDCETWHDHYATVPGGELQKLRLGVATAYRLEKGHRTRQKWLTFKEPEPFWQLVESRLDNKRPLWIVGHNLAYDWGVVGGWGVLCSKRFQVLKHAVSGSLFYLKGTLDGKPIVLCDTFNYYRVSLKAIGKSLGLTKHEFPRQEESDDVWETYCQRDVEVTASALDNLISFVRSQQLGPWQPSIAGLAFSGYRSRFMQHHTLVHCNAKALQLERGSYCGGIVDTPRIGRIPHSPIHELDVCSMYPAVCRNPVPTKIRGYSARVGLKALSTLMGRYHCIADVDVSTKDYCYPVKMQSGTYYPVGQYRTCLAHPELEIALRSGHVTRVHAASWYEANPIFANYMEWAIALKTQFRREGNEAWATIAKYYGTNLYGKTGQMTPRWKEWGAEAMRLLEEKHGLYPGQLSEYDDKPPTLYDFEETCEVAGIADPVDVRDYYGVTEVSVGEHESRESCPAIAATITSYSRVLMRRFQQCAGDDNWYYTDTDSIWCNEEGKKRLEDAGHVGDEVLGLLKVEKQHKAMVVYGPKDYETDLVCKRKGVRATAIPATDGGWTQLQFPSPLIQIKDGHKDGVFVRKVTKHLHRQVTRCKILSNGRTRPLKFPGERPAR